MNMSVPIAVFFFVEILVQIYRFPKFFQNESLQVSQNEGEISANGFVYRSALFGPGLTHLLRLPAALNYSAADVANNFFRILLVAATKLISFYEKRSFYVGCILKFADILYAKKYFEKIFLVGFCI